MDTTEQFIKQCEKAEEIQGGWKPDIGDCFYWREDGGTLFIGTACFDYDVQIRLVPQNLGRLPSFATGEMEWEHMILEAQAEVTWDIAFKAGYKEGYEEGFRNGSPN